MAQLAGNLEGDQRAHAVAEEDEGKLALASDRLRHLARKLLCTCKWRIVEPSTASGVADRDELAAGRQAVRPGAKRLRAPCGVGEAKHANLWVRRRCETLEAPTCET